MIGTVDAFNAAAASCVRDQSISTGFSQKMAFSARAAAFR